MYKNFLLLLLSLALIKSNAQNLGGLHFGTDSTLDVITWNIEWFPKNGQATIDYVEEIILSLDADVIALQEMDDKSSFVELRNRLDGYEGFYVSSTYLELAYLFKSSEIVLKDHYRIHTGNLRVFPRAPYIMEAIHENEEYVLINNHFKCCGDGFLNPADPYDEEKRRYDASIMLEEYINSSHMDANVILLGDLNDLLTDEPSNNVFKVFLNDPSNYRFTDMEIAQGSSSDWSYPTWPSHLDHIMITSELYEVFEKPASEVLTIRIDDYLPGGWNEYDQYVSDHRPVGLKLHISQPSAVTEINGKEITFYNYPNPFKENTIFYIDKNLIDVRIDIFELTGKMVGSLFAGDRSQALMWEPGPTGPGIYYARLTAGGQYIASIKIIITE